MKFLMRVGKIIISLAFVMGICLLPNFSNQHAFAQSTCPDVQNTPSFTIVYGEANLQTGDAPVGTLVIARSPRGDVVGCSVINTSGIYGAMFIYGEDTTVVPAIPGMRAGETINFYMNTSLADVTPLLIWQNDKDLHEVDLMATSLPAPVAAFSASTTTGVIPFTVNFTNQSTNATSYLWDFGDGGTSTSTNPSHSFTSAGSYTVQLTATGSGGVDVETKTNYIIAYQPVVANFSAAPLTGTAPLTVQFTNSSSGSFDAFLWNFGDGITNTTTINPQHIYEEAGAYSVSLTVSGPGGNNTRTRTEYITVGAGLPEADFDANPLTGIAPLQVKFINQSLRYKLSLWTFGDGSTSSLNNPTHTYTTKGDYSVTLVVAGSGESDSITKENYITVYAPVHVSFDANPKTGQVPLIVTFTNQTTGDYNNFLWDFGDGQTSVLQNPVTTFTQSGAFTVTLTASGLGGTDSLSLQNFINTLPVFNIYLPILQR